MKKLIFLIIIVFALGWATNSLYDYYSYTEQPKIIPYLVNSERISPSDWIKEDQIYVFDNQVILDIKDVTWTRYANTNSMDPVLDETATGLEIRPKTPEELHLGDIISYKSDIFDAFIVHRIIRIGDDEKGWYAIVKGDNSTIQDPERVRFNQIDAVLIGIIY